MNMTMRGGLYGIRMPETPCPASIRTTMQGGSCRSGSLLTWAGEGGSVRYSLVTYRYDASGNRTEEKRYLDYQTGESASGKTNTIHYTYNRSNRLVKITDDTGACMEYTYNSVGLLEAERIHTGEDCVQETRYFYDGRECHQTV